MGSAAGERTAAADEGQLATLRRLETIRRRAAALERHAGEDLAVLRRLHDGADFLAEIGREVVIVGRHDDILIGVSACVPGWKAPRDELRFPVPRRHGQDQKLNSALLDLFDHPRNGVVVLGVLVFGLGDVVGVFRVRRRELDEGHEPLTGLNGGLLPLVKRELRLEVLGRLFLQPALFLFPGEALSCLRVDRTGCWHQ